jgi:rare lipoprotein A
MEDDTGMRLCLLAIVGLLLGTAAYGQTPAPIQQDGKASYYVSGPHGHMTMANGHRFNPNKRTAASRTLPFGTKVKVINKANGKSTHVTITDRGPGIPDRTIDLSRKAAQDVGMERAGLALVTVVADPAAQTDPKVKQQLLDQQHE